MSLRVLTRDLISFASATPCWRMYSLSLANSEVSIWVCFLLSMWRNVSMKSPSRMHFAGSERCSALSDLASALRDFGFEMSNSFCKRLRKA